MTRRRKQAVAGLLLGLSLLLLSACEGAGSSDDGAGAARAVDAAGPADSNQKAQEGVAGSSLPTLDPDIVAVADMSLRVDDVFATVSSIASTATTVGGLVAGRDTSSDPDDPSRSRANLVLRVPTDSLDSVMERVRTLGDVLSEDQKQQDVTAQVVDVDSRVQSARSSVARIRILLDQANTIGEVVRIESELAQRESDLESLLAQQRTLADQTALATLSVSLLGPATPQQDEERASGFVGGLSRGWDAFTSVLVASVTAFGLVLPFLVTLAIVALPARVAWRRRYGVNSGPGYPPVEDHVPAA